MRVLFIGGTGNLSAACTVQAQDKGFEVVHFNRGRVGNLPGATVHTGVEAIVGDIRDRSAARDRLAQEHFDCVVDWIAFTPDDIQFDIELFRGRTKQFIFISSASVYHKPPGHYVITESTPPYNPFWEYSRNKIACEEILLREYRNAGFPMTIVRPSHTYSDGWFPTTFESTDFTVPQRMLDGKPVVVHGDGQSLWTITHVEDFAKGFTGLITNPAAIGDTFHITSDESITWDHMHQTIAAALGTEARIVHAPSEVIARLSPQLGEGLLGDKQFSVVFDNAKIKRIVPGYQATIPFFEGMRRSVAWIEANPERKSVNRQLDSLIDDIVAAMGPIVR